MRSLRTLPTIFNCFKYSTYVVVKPDGVSWSAYIKNDVDIHAEVFPYPTVFIISSFLIVLPIIELSKWIEKTKMAQAFVFLGQNSLFYFAFSGFVREIFIRIIDSTMTMDPHIESLLCTLSMIVVLIIPAMITRKYFPWLVGVKKDRFI